jgi:hypothetical protein
MATSRRSRLSFPAAFRGSSAAAGIRQVRSEAFESQAASFPAISRAARIKRRREVAPASYCCLGVITGHSRSKIGVASLAYDSAIHPFSKKMDARIKSAHDNG